ncbi:MAG TPA: CvpA family protein [Cytophagales bacterium]|nr:CvpA family protein [Cytophagales bacterium]
MYYFNPFTFKIIHYIKYSKFIADNILIFVKKILNYLDIFIVSILIFGFFRGFIKGLIMELSSLLAIILGTYGSLKFSDFTFQLLSKNFSDQIENINESYLKIASFAFTFLVIIVLVSIIGKVLTKVVKMIALGLINKVFGGVFGSIKYLLLLSFCFVFFQNLNSTLFLVDESFFESTLFYKYIIDLGDIILNFFNSNKESINFFN